MKRDWQRGMTLVELLVAMAVTSILLVGLTSVFFDVTSRYQDWAHRLQTASTGVSLAATLQADGHRYVHCDSTPLRTHVADLALCAADDTGSAVVTYHVTGTGPWVITRQPGTQAAAFVLRSDTHPDLWIDCFDTKSDGSAGSTVAGHIHVYNLRLPSDSLDTNPNDIETFSVYYVAPRGTRGC
jgi:prepilin-type N-terminal cleavage/methylation domain-containing protein